MSAYSAFVSLRQYLHGHPAAQVEDAIRVLRASDTDSAGLDYTGAFILHQNVSPDTDLNHPLGLRAVIKELVRANQPWWVRLTPYGRDKVRSALGQDQSQCFRNAGLFDLVPNDEVVTWWDELALSVRGSADAERTAIGREAEKLSLEHERKRLKALAINEQPAWVSLEDNTLGYDIQSYDLVDSRIVNTLIEVKSAASDVIFVTRNEWSNAISAGNRYLFHIWRMPEVELLEIAVADIAPHIPSDRGKGMWQDTKITILP